MRLSIVYTTPQELISLNGAVKGMLEAILDGFKNPECHFVQFNFYSDEGFRCEVRFRNMEGSLIDSPGSKIYYIQAMIPEGISVALGLDLIYSEVEKLALVMTQTKLSRPFHMSSGLGITWSFNRVF